MLGGPRLQEDRGGASISLGGAPLYAPPLHPQLFADLFDLCLQQALLCFQPLLFRLPETAVTSPVEPRVGHRTKMDRGLNEDSNMEVQMHRGPKGHFILESQKAWFKRLYSDPEQFVECLTRQNNGVEML